MGQYKEFFCPTERGTMTIKIERPIDPPAAYALQIITTLHPEERFFAMRPNGERVVLIGDYIGGSLLADKGSTTLNVGDKVQLAEGLIAEATD